MKRKPNSKKLRLAAETLLPLVRIEEIKAAEGIYTPSAWDSCYPNTCNIDSAPCL